VLWLEIFVGIVVSTLQRHIPHRCSEYVVWEFTAHRDRIWFLRPERGDGCLLSLGEGSPSRRLARPGCLFLSPPLWERCQ
jgi:hypothetical protein